MLSYHHPIFCYIHLRTVYMFYSLLRNMCSKIRTFENIATSPRGNKLNSCSCHWQFLAMNMIFGSECCIHKCQSRRLCWGAADTFPTQSRAYLNIYGLPLHCSIMPYMFFTNVTHAFSNNYSNIAIATIDHAPYLCRSTLEPPSWPRGRVQKCLRNKIITP